MAASSKGIATNASKRFSWSKVRSSSLCCCYCYVATPVAVHPAHLRTDLQVFSKCARPGPETPTSPATKVTPSHAKSPPSSHGSSAAPSPAKLPNTGATTPTRPEVDSAAHLRGPPASENVSTAVTVQGLHHGSTVTMEAKPDRTPVPVVAPPHFAASPLAHVQESAGVQASSPAPCEDALAPPPAKVPTLFFSTIISILSDMCLDLKQ